MSPTSPVADNLRPILTEASSAASERLVRLAEETARRLAEGKGTAGEVGKAQIRAIFDEVRQIEALWLANPERALSRLQLLKPKLAYRVARAEGVAPLADILIPAVDLVSEASRQSPEHTKLRFVRLVELTEAILAYYTAEVANREKTKGGKEGGDERARHRSGVR